MIANYFHLSDDVAGATLMAAGASSPELFSSIIALFVTHSALGLGTIVGSEIFNQLMICAGSVLSSRTGKLKLDGAILAREVGFYALSIILLMIALRDTRPHEDDPDGPEFIYIDFADGLMLFAAYCLYVLVCANYDAMLALMQQTKDKWRALSKDDKEYGSMSSSSSSRKVTIDIPHTLPFLRHVVRDPAENFVTPASRRHLLEAAKSTHDEESRVSLYITKDGGEHSDSAMTAKPSAPLLSMSSRQSAISENSTQHRNSSLLARSVKTMASTFSEGVSLRLFDLMVDIEKPTDARDIFDIEKNEFDERLSCFLWQRSLFYNKAKIAMGGWHLRWFSFTHDMMASVPNRKQYNRHTLIYKRFYSFEVDENRLIIKLVASSEKHRDFYLMAPSQNVYKEVVRKLEELIDNWRKEDIDIDEMLSSSIRLEGLADDEPSLISFPSDGTWYEIVLYLVLFPLKLLMHVTVPDVRHMKAHGGDPTASLPMALVSAVSCLIWLIVGSYAMVASLEGLAELLDIPDAVVGATFSAAGTSLPNYVASQVAARQGFGNQAVSNAFGSNTFNIMVGLGLPWLLYTANGDVYNRLRAERILEMVIILGSVLVIFTVLVLLSRLYLHRWHAWIFFGLYVSYTVYTVAEVYITGATN